MAVQVEQVAAVLVLRVPARLAQPTRDRAAVEAVTALTPAVLVAAVS